MCFQASLQEQHTKQGLGVMHDTAMMEEGAQQQHKQALVALVATPGLQNLTGEYNCFLNVIVQCLWHCLAFRSGMFHRLDPEQLQVASLAACGQSNPPIPTPTEA